MPFAQEAGKLQNFPWMDQNLSPDERAEMVLKQLTLDEKILLLHGNGMPGWPGAPTALDPLSATAARDSSWAVTAAGHSNDPDERRCLRGSCQRGKWALLDRATVECGVGGKLGPAGRV